MSCPVSSSFPLSFHPPPLSDHCPRQAFLMTRCWFLSFYPLMFKLFSSVWSIFVAPVATFILTFDLHAGLIMSLYGKKEEVFVFLVEWHDVQSSGCFDPRLTFFNTVFFFLASFVSNLIFNFNLHFNLPFFSFYATFNIRIGEFT